MVTWVKTADIVIWSETPESMFCLPALVRRLIHSTADSIEAINFPAGKDVVGSGFDGVTSATGLRFVPGGKCYWEVSIREDVLKKANEDHAKRVEQVISVERKNSTYVCVTTRRWPEKQKSREEWQIEIKESGGWKDVRILDAGSLEEWLEIAPAVSIWFARLAGLIGSADEFLDLDYQWESRTSGISAPALSANFFLEGRDVQRGQIHDFFQNDEPELFLESDDREECVDVLAATYSEFAEDPADEVGAKVLVVETQSAFKKLVRLGRPMTLIQGATLTLNPGDIAEALQAGYRIVHTLVKKGAQTGPVVRFSRRTCHELEERLKSSGFDDEKARILSLDSNGRVFVLKRFLRPGSAKPDWARTNPTDLIPALLIGSWIDGHVADRETLSLLSSSEYDLVASKLQRLRNLDEAPLELGKAHWCGGPDERWAWQSRAEAWALVAPFFRGSDYEHFIGVAELVLGEENPRYELPEGERVYAEIRGHKLEVSPELRKGVAEGLALLGSRSKQTSDPAKSKAAALIVVRNILEDAPWKLWASLSSHLPTLAEASPDAFLESVEKCFEKGGDDLRALFIESDGSLLGGSTPHSGLLWALEGLAWHRDYFNRAVLLLAQLAEVDPGGNTSNRPANSLSEIFVGWINNTTVGNEAKISALKLIYGRYPEVGYELYRQIVPSAHESSMGAHKPRWRPWLEGHDSHPLMTEFESYVSLVFETFVELSTGNADRLVHVISLYESRRSRKQLKLIRDCLSSEKTDLWDDSEKEKVSTAIRGVVNRHRYFSDADWALPGEELSLLESLREKYEPEGLHFCFRWLFESKRVDLHWLGDRDMDYQDQEEMVKSMRQSALRSIFEAEGISGVRSFAETVGEQFLVGSLIGELRIQDAEEAFLPGAINSVEIDPFANGFLRGAVFSDPWKWVGNDNLKGWSKEAVGHFVINLPFENRTWSWLKDMPSEIEDFYWSETAPWSGNLSNSELEIAIRELLGRGRPGVAIEFLGTAIHRKQVCSPDLIIETLDSLLVHQDQVSRDYAICEIFTHLQSEVGVDQSKLGQLEWAYLSVLDPYQGGCARTLQHSLANSPSFFVEVLSLVYRGENEPVRDRSDLSNDERNQIERARELMENWKTCPCVDSNGMVDSSSLKAYVEDVRDLSGQAGRCNIAMMTLGSKFAHSPGEGETWPPSSVCEIMEKIPGDWHTRGFKTAIRNKRGVHSWTAGNEEMEISEDFRKKAERVNARWPKVAAALLEISEDYKSQSLRAAEVNPYSD